MFAVCVRCSLSLRYHARSTETSVFYLWYVAVLGMWDACPCLPLTVGRTKVMSQTELVCDSDERKTFGAGLIRSNDCLRGVCSVCLPSMVVNVLVSFLRSLTHVGPT